MSLLRRIWKWLQARTTPYGAVSVDQFWYLTTYTGEHVDDDLDGVIDVDIITPSTDKSIISFMTAISTDSGAGEVELRFKTSDQLVAKIYPIRFFRSGLIYSKVKGNVNEPLSLVATDLDPGSKVFVAVLYVEVQS